jgi:hypothetical protein
MNIKDLVPDREICQEAKEKGVEIESFYKWAEILTGPTLICGEWSDDATPAPLTDEILKVLPERAFSMPLYIKKFPLGYSVGYSYSIENKKLSNALLLLAIKLKEENII